jgi:hypothetical protein
MKRGERTAQSGAPSHHWAQATAAGARIAAKSEVFMMLMVSMGGINTVE